MSNKKNTLLAERNAAIRNDFVSMIKSGLRFMDAYSCLGLKYDLSERQVRRICSHK